MKATGIVRRIDDLGRVVIPKEIRRTMHLREGAPLEIFTDKDGGLIFKKYSPIGELSDFSSDLCEAMRKATDAVAVVCDRDVVVAATGGAKKELTGKAVSAELGDIMEGRAVYRRRGAGAAVPVCDGADKYRVSVAAPIFCDGDIAGCMLFAARPGETEGGEMEYRLAQTAAQFLGRQMES